MRLENVSRDAMRKRNANNKVPPADELKIFLDKEYPLDPMEDPPVNLFTEVIAYHGGDYLILPGITESASFVLNNLLSAIYNWPTTELPHQFKSNCSHVTHLLLSISDFVVKRAGLTRYVYGQMDERHITTPTDKRYDDLRKIVFISNNEMDKMLGRFNIAPKALESFIADPDDPGINDPHTEDSPFLKNPLMITKDGYVVVSPASLSYALLEFIREQAVIFNCQDAMYKAFHELVWNEMKMNLQNIGFRPIEIEGIETPQQDHVETILTKFDDDKIALIQYISTGQPGKLPGLKDLAKQREVIFTKIAELPNYSSFQFLDITIPSPVGNNLMFAIMGNPKSQTVSLHPSDFDVLVKSKECRALNIWKFSLARNSQVPREAKMMGLTFLDEFKIYKDNSDSFYMSDETGFDFCQWIYGHSQAFVEEAKHRSDEHSVAVHTDTGIATIVVQKKDKYAPIYFSKMDMLAGDLRFSVEGFSGAVWVKAILPQKPSAELRHIYWEITDTYSYWLWQIEQDIKEQLNKTETPA